MSILPNSFRLGDEWPDWWADMVTRNIAVTYNDDGRWRGGPDRARIAQGNGYVWAMKGDYIVRHADGDVTVIRSVSTTGRQ